MKLKRILIILFSSVLLIGCGNGKTEKVDTGNKAETENKKETESVETKTDEKREVEIKNEVKTFVESFNHLASLSDDVKAIDNIEDMVEGEDESTQVLYSSSEYGIVAIYDEDSNLNRYSIVIPKDQPYEELKGTALNATLHIGAALDLDVDKLSEKFKEALSKESDVYLEDGYSIMFFNHKLSGQSDFGMVVEFLVP